MMITVGEPAPPFELEDHDGQRVSLDDLEGEPTLLYFYPRDETPGCTAQACGIRDHWSDFREAGIRVIGISPDRPESHAAFRENHDLPHTLLSDPDHEMMERYGAWGEKNLYGKRSVGVIRSSVLLDADGTVLKHWRRVSAEKHAEQVLAAATDLLG